MFPCFGCISKQLKQTDLFQKEPKQTENVYGNNRKKQFCFKMNQNKPKMYIKTTEKNSFVSKWTEKNENVLNTKIRSDLNLCAIDTKFSQIINIYKCRIICREWECYLCPAKITDLSVHMKVGALQKTYNLLELILKGQSHEIYFHPVFSSMGSFWSHSRCSRAFGLPGVQRTPRWWLPSPLEPGELRLPGVQSTSKLFYCWYEKNSCWS